MTSLTRRTLTILLALVLAAPISGANANGLMTIGQLSDFLDKGPAEKVVVVAYVQGVIEGFLAMDSLLEKEQGKRPEFCRVFEQAKDGAVEHPAKEAEMIVRRWEQTGRSMDTLAVDVLLMYMTAKYGC